MPDEGGISKSLIGAMQVRTAVVALGASALRGQGAPGVIAAAREFLGKMDLGEFAVERESAFRLQLDAQTDRLVQAFPQAARSWGAARKAINLFLRDALYNAYLREACNLALARNWYEIPLDSATSRGLRKQDGGDSLPGWLGVKHLTTSASDEYQRFAFDLARARDTRHRSDHGNAISPATFSSAPQRVLAEVFRLVFYPRFRYVHPRYQAAVLGRPWLRVR